MKKTSLWAGTALCASLWLAASGAHAHELEIGVASSYIDTATFNQRFSGNPVVQMTATFDLGANFYFEPYIYLDPEDLLEGESSEYGFEVGTSYESDNCFALEGAFGRWSNYNGLGADVGDWFARVGVSCGGASLAVVNLWGDTNETVAHAGYDIELGSLTATPSLAYLFDAETVNPGLTLSYSLSDNISLSGQLIYPEVEDDFGKIERELQGSIGISWVFGGQ